jgi:hypothetical protein
MLFVLGLALLVVPSLAAQSVNGDRERGTLATLQVTRLSAGEITLGKFVAAWGTALGVPRPDRPARRVRHDAGRRCRSAGWWS